ncbi:thioesterase [Dactylosporangium roseum]|uniref:Thioesterase n=1 Tax=Dactylosporangium roseum TaxID=47989 RepID=A0ABY5ZFA6_9ACTN|nr:thioesterase domain-containing protein [Dactylosporangium roseum]UWZ39432.1 thioesterase [Dactylosporangium roseum]
MSPRWFVPLAARPAAVTRLFMFPAAGGGPGSFADLAARLPAEIEPWSVNLPGRQARLHEPPWTDLTAVVDTLADRLAPLSRDPFALFGYCGGALMAYLVARRLHVAGRRPVRLLVGSAAAPDLAMVPRRLHLLASDRFWAQILDQGGVHPELAGQPELRPVFEPALRADFALLAGYRHARCGPLPFGISVLYGSSDRSLHRGALLGWRRQTDRPLALEGVTATHWLVEDAADRLSRVIGAHLTSNPRAVSAP